jgi:hypothetical protein
VVSYGVSENQSVLADVGLCPERLSTERDRRFESAKARGLKSDQEDGVRKGMILAMAGMVLLAGCDTGNKPAAPKAPPKPKWQYQIAFDAAQTKPDPSGLSIPMVKYTALKADETERRATLVVRFDNSSAKNPTGAPMVNKMIMAPVDIKGEQGTLSADYMSAADKGLASIMGAYHMNGKIKISVALARSSLTNQAGDTEVDQKRLSDWIDGEVTFKNPHPKG